MMIMGRRIDVCVVGIGGDSQDVIGCISSRV